jgi:hypothetical protein
MIISDETLDNVILSVSEGSHEILRAKALRMTKMLFIATTTKR